MNINSWLTVITIFTAVIALLPKDDLKIQIFGKSKIAKILGVIMMFINLLIIPFLIFFDKIIIRIPALNIFTVSWGIDPKNIAFILFYLSFVWLVKELFYKSSVNTNKKTIELFTDLLNNKSFPDFFKLFTKYTNKAEIIKKWNLYRTILFQPQFLNNIIDYRTSYILSFWTHFDTEKEFQSIFKLFLNKPNSSYYSEIKGNRNYNSILDDKPFLQTILIDNLKQSIDNGIFLILTDQINQHLKSQNEYLNIYNQEHYYPRIKDNEGYDLPIYYHIHFIGLMYSSAIKNDIDISTISNKYINPHSFFSDIIKLIIDNIVLTENNLDMKFQTNYLWLINEIFSIQSKWLEQFGHSENEKNFNDNSSYISFIPSSFRFCFRELYKGLNKNKITLSFIKVKIADHIMYDYFNGLNEKLKKSIDNEILKQIPKNIRKEIIDFSVNERLGFDLDNLTDNDITHHKNRKDLLNLKNIINT